MQAFTHTASPARIVFGRGTLESAADEVRRLGASRALVLSTPQQRGQAETLAASLGPLSAGLFDSATMHTPVEVTLRAVAVFEKAGADCIVAIGGGSTTGLGKAIAARNGAPQLVIPTTYAGSEATPILGETENGVKTTRRGPEILPETVIYDPDLTTSLPRHLAVTSGLNAMAHAAEGVYARDGSPVYTLMALEGLRAFRDALPAIVDDPDNAEGRDGAVYGAWLCGTVLGGVGMSVHHKLCHTLGGSLDLPHADTHAILLPHTIAFIEETAPEALASVAGLFGGRAGAGLYDFARSLGAPLRLADLGVTETQLDRMAELATANPYWSPRPLDRKSIRGLLQRAWAGKRPD
ncbi:maleylacetate reductase [uncultured Martelella sp.]|uniref:maleylacetate reductase n=1 Tax=uncultured Martelella sp. TaxID=392331 RepID=UPI0029C87B45|nr:maleylacetate reductase [uncultured Martelella sp.]